MKKAALAGTGTFGGEYSVAILKMIKRKRRPSRSGLMYGSCRCAEDGDRSHEATV